VPFYQTPASQTRQLAASRTELLSGNYTFADSNNNGMADGWEQQQFGQVSPGRTRQTDTDADGMPDYAEFITGTNPNDRTSKLNAIIQPVGNNWRVQWSSVIGRAYRVQGSIDAVHWAPVSDWMQASSTATIYTLPAPQPGAPYLFRVEVQP
jgi:hypothetical protein